ncbi:MAG: V-type ATPase subunit [Nitrospirae bacterium]|nr:V-type ATPase subunit [Nitrospirota bacterium]
MPYSYLNVRIRSVEKSLLTEGQIKGFCTLLSLRDLTTALQKGDYGFPADERLPPLRKVELGLRKGYVGKIRHVVEAVNEGPGTLFRLFLGRWDLFNLKTLIRSWIRRRPSEEVLELTVPASFLDDPVLYESLKQPSLPAMISFWLTLSPSRRGFIRKHLREVLTGALQHTGDVDLLELEMALDRAYFRDAIQGRVNPETREYPLMKRWLRFQVDGINLFAALRIAAEKERRLEDPLAYFIPGGDRIRSDHYRELAGAADWKQSLHALPSYWGDPLSEALAHSPVFIPPLLYLEWLWECLFLRELSRDAVADPLSIALGFCVLQKALREMRMLRLIAVAINYGIPSQEIEDWIDRGYRCASSA